MVQAPLASPSARQARARILDLARTRVIDSDLLRELSHQLRIVVPFSAALWCASDPLTLLATSPARLENVGGQCDRFWEREFLVQDFNHFRDLARAERPVSSLYRATAGQPGRSLRYREFKHDRGFGDELRAVFRGGSGAWGFISLWREDGQQPFSPAEEKLIADLSAPIAEAFRRTAVLQAAAFDEAPDAPGLLVFGRDGRLTSFNDQAEMWLRELPPSLPHDNDGFDVPIPTEIRAVVALARAVEAGIEQGVARARIQGRGGRWLVVNGFPLRGPADAGSSTAVVIEPAKAAEIAPIIVEAYGLGQREQQVAALIARGLSTAQIAKRLYLSPYTVRDYVKSIFEKVGVSSRGELVARIFAEHYQAPLRDSIYSTPHAPDRRSPA